MQCNLFMSLFFMYTDENENIKHHCHDNGLGNWSVLDGLHPGPQLIILILFFAVL